MSKLPIPTVRSLPIALLRARERVMGPIRDMLADVDVTEQQWRVLRALDESGPMEPTVISDMACLLLPSLTRILQKLEEKKLILRTTNPYDKRRQVVAITDAGQALIEENQAASHEIAEAVRTHMGQERYELLLELLHELDQFEMQREPALLAK